MTRAGWYVSRDGEGRRRLPGRDGSPEASLDQVAPVPRSLTVPFVIAARACTIGTLLTGPQAFGVVMVNFDERVIDAHAALLGLFGFAASAWAMFVTAILLHRAPRSRNRLRVTTYLLFAVIAVQVASVGGLTEHVGLFLFS